MATDYLDKYISILAQAKDGSLRAGYFQRNNADLYQLIERLSDQIGELLNLASQVNVYEMSEYIFDNFWRSFTPEILNKSFAYACKYGNIRILQLYLNQNVDIQYEINLPLINACAGGRIKTVKLLIEKGANVNGNKKKNDLKYGFPLANAANSNINSFDIVKYLIEKGADPTTFTIALPYAVNRANFRTADYLLINGAIIDERFTLYQISKNILKYLISRGLDLNKEGEYLIKQIEKSRMKNELLPYMNEQIKGYNEFMSSELYKQVMSSTLDELKDALGYELYFNQEVAGINKYKEKLIQEYRRIEILNVKDLDLYYQVMFNSTYEEIMEALVLEPQTYNYDGYETYISNEIMDDITSELISKYRENGTL